MLCVSGISINVENKNNEGQETHRGLCGQQEESAAAGAKREKADLRQIFKIWVWALVAQILVSLGPRHAGLTLFSCPSTEGFQERLGKEQEESPVTCLGTGRKGLLKSEPERGTCGLALSQAAAEVRGAGGAGKVHGAPAAQAGAGEPGETL